MQVLYIYICMQSSSELRRLQRADRMAAQRVADIGLQWYVVRTK
jgi:hypothetical protein